MFMRAFMYNFESFANNVEWYKSSNENGNICLTTEDDYYDIDNARFL